MKSVHSGSLMIEYIVYTAIIAILLYNVVRYSFVMHASLRQQHKKEHALLASMVLEDILQSDIRASSCDQNDWIAVDDGTYVYTIKDHHVGWKMVQGDLFRLQGAFNGATGEWSSVHKTLIARAISTFCMKLQCTTTDARVSGVIVSVACGTHPSDQHEYHLFARRGEVV